MKNFRFKNAILIIAAIVMFSACEEDENNNNDPAALEVITKQLDASSFTNWVYYSFSEETVVDVTDPATSTNWDIALMRSHFKTNSGTSGNFDGGSFDAGVVDFDTYVEAPETGYVEDDFFKVYDFAIQDSSSISANKVLETWGEFNMSAMPPTFETSNKVFVVKTAVGKYVKMIGQSYYGADGSGYITFKYVYQPDGSTKFE